MAWFWSHFALKVLLCSYFHVFLVCLDLFPLQDSIKCLWLVLHLCFIVIVALCLWRLESMLYVEFGAWLGRVREYQ
jgi:hypothetical protein